jgi:antitoxin HicB
VACGKFGQPCRVTGKPDIFRLSRGHAGRLARHYEENAEDPSGRTRAGETKIQGVAIMARKNPHIGSSFESWLDEAGIREEVAAAAIKAVIARQLVSEMKKKGITKPKMAELMKTSRAQIDRLLDPENGSATIETLQRAARIVGRELRLQLV